MEGWLDQDMEDFEVGEGLHWQNSMDTEPASPEERRARQGGSDLEMD